MIRLTKSPEPEVLAEQKIVWTAEYVGGVDRRRYAHADIRTALRDETRRKCAYCESRMEHVSPAHIEHIIPKSRRPDLVCEWSNLTIACQTCNVNKGTYFDLVCPLLNPYVDDPKAHLRWKGPWVIPISADTGKVTVTRLDLNRSELLYKRMREQERALDILTQMNRSPEPVRIALQEDLHNMLRDDAEFSAAVNALVDSEMESASTST
jgi:uncharacterized protein (TIGR02646 family)